MKIGLYFAVQFWQHCSQCCTHNAAVMKMKRVFLNVFFFVQIKTILSIKKNGSIVRNTTQQTNNNKISVTKSISLLVTLTTVGSPDFENNFKGRNTKKFENPCLM